MSAHLTSLSTWGVIVCLAAFIWCAVVLFDMVTEHLALERESRDPADGSPHPFDAVVTDQLDEYADAADGIPDDELPDWVLLEDGCHAYDHKLGRHRKGWLPEQRGAQ